MNELAYLRAKVAQLEGEVSTLLVSTLNHNQIFLRWKEVFRENLRLKKEVEVLRQYGNKDCTAMADEQLKKEDLCIDS